MAETNRAAMQVLSARARARASADRCTAPRSAAGSGRGDEGRARMTIFPFTKRRDYRTRFFSCLSDVPIFCKVLWCPCITSGLLVGNMEGRTFNPIVRRRPF